MQKTKSCVAKYFCLSATAAVLFLLIFHADSYAQRNFSPGEQVEASPMALKDDQYYKQCTVIKFDQSSNSYFLRCGGTEYTVPPTFVRAARSPIVQSNSQPAKPTFQPKRNSGQFKVGDRVMASVAGLKAERDYQPCTVMGGLKNGAYALRCDPHNGQPTMDFSVRPDWIKPDGNAGPKPLPADCPFNKNYGPVSNTAAASAALFKSVIFEWQRSTQDFYDFGLTFLNFQIVKTFRNAAIGNGRKLVDTAPLGAAIHNVKAKELICQKSSEITKRWVREIEYACYKNASREWVCKNNAPKYLEQTSIPNED